MLKTFRFLMRMARPAVTQNSVPYLTPASYKGVSFNKQSIIDIITEEIIKGNVSELFSPAMLKTQDPAEYSVAAEPPNLAK